MANLGRRFGRRYAFATSVELTDLETVTPMTVQMSDLSPFGCHVDAKKILPKGTKVRIKVVHAGATFAAFGKVAYSTADSGMGLVFTKIETGHQKILEKWIGKIREAREIA
ncbi:MAG TPA: PilZ domain-containing protein [Candidatus Acidoferrales bacterium]|nr:PilZ domain-containing protein [Candidatus Acidoferrales bacterium]